MAVYIDEFNAEASPLTFRRCHELDPRGVFIRHWRHHHAAAMAAKPQLLIEPPSLLRFRAGPHYDRVSYPQCRTQREQVQKKKPPVLRKAGGSVAFWGICNAASVW
jgi:hypothetical protein